MTQPQTPDIGDIEVPEHLLNPKPQIPQPELRQLENGERVVRIAGLRFILPAFFKEGEVIDSQKAQLFNALYHNAIVNKFGKIRITLLENPACTYEELDEALQGFAESFVWTPRTPKVDVEDKKPAKTEEYKFVEAFARPHFNKAMRGHGLSREEYEERLTAYITKNWDLLKSQAEAEQDRLNDLISSLGSADDE